MEAKEYLLSIGFDDSHLPMLFNDDDKSRYTIAELMEAYKNHELSKLKEENEQLTSDNYHNENNLKISEERVKELEDNEIVLADEQVKLMDENDKLDYYIRYGETITTIHLSDGTVRLPKNYEGIEG